ncbi:MAG: hypothetical protein HYZ49_02445 [Chloroflexi bacterium]|nr:hypothetical protein [Chloroflexota bacterium]
MAPNFSLELVKQGDEAYKRKDYVEAQRLYEQALEAAKARREDTNYIYSSLAKAYKKNKRYRDAYLLSRKALPTPAAFRDCAICLRSLAKEAKKGHTEASYRQALDDLYRLAVHACLCYGAHDCQSGVSGIAYEKATVISQGLKGRQINATFQQNGRIFSGGLLTEQDYDMLIDAFGQNENTYVPQQEYADILQAANEEMKRQEEEFQKSLSRL